MASSLQCSDSLKSRYNFKFVFPVLLHLVSPSSNPNGNVFNERLCDFDGAFWQSVTIGLAAALHLHVDEDYS